MERQIELAALTDAVSALGYSDATLDAIRDAFYTDFPSKRAVPLDRAMSTIPHDALVPTKWAVKVFKSLGIHPTDAERIIDGMFSPGAIPLGHPDREVLLEKVLELLPTPRSIQRGQKERNAEGAPTVPDVDPMTQEEYKTKVASVTKKILRSPYMGFSVVRGNSKIGTISQFSLPAGHNFRGASCPGATEFCESLCYAKDTLFTFWETQYYVNWAYLLLWPDRFLQVWKDISLTEVVRIHVGGDFFSPEYVGLWVDVIKARQDTRFYAYTRSWQNGRGKIANDFIDPLTTLSELPNMRLVLSCDRQTGVPDANMIPAAIRAWLAADDNDLPGEPVELVFRDKDGMSKGAVPELADSPVCPVERSPKFVKRTGAVTCRNCTFCFSTGHLMFNRRDDDPSLLDSFAKLDVNKRVANMFKGFWKPPGGGASMGSAARSCCGADVPCAYCGNCAFCLCEC